jgi:hypothetical protein
MTTCPKCAEAQSVMEWTADALDGAPLSDFAESFRLPREARALYQRTERLARERDEAAELLELSRRECDRRGAELTAVAPAAAQPPPDLAPLVLDGASALEEAAERWGEVNPDALAAKARDLRAALAGAAQPRPKTYAEQFQADLAADRAAAQPQAEGAPDPDDWPTCSRCGVVLVCDGTRHTTAALAAEREAGRREGYELGWRDRGNAAPRPETPPADKERT